MAADVVIHCRVSIAMKAALRVAADRQQLTESAFLKRMLEVLLQVAPASDIPPAHGRRQRYARLYVRLTAEDSALLRERATARGMAVATYAANALRAHVRGRARLVHEELAAVKGSARELRAIGVNLNNLVQLANQSGRFMGPTRDDLRAFLKISSGLRDHIAGLIRANAMSWGIDA